MTRLWKSANNADSHKPLGFAAFSTGPTAGTHRHQPVFRQQRSTLRSGISCLKNGDTHSRSQMDPVLSRKLIEGDHPVPVPQ